MKASFIWSRLRFNATRKVAIALHRRFEEVQTTCVYFFGGEEEGRFMQYVVPFVP